MKNLFLSIILLVGLSSNAQLKEVATTNLTELTEAVTDKAVKTIAEAKYESIQKESITEEDKSKSLASRVYDDMKSMAPELKSALGVVAESLNTTAEKVWQILVRQQYVIAIGHLCILLLSFISLRTFILFAKRSATDLTATNEVKPSNILLSILFFLLFAFGATHSTISFGDMLTGFINPEFGAIKMILNIAGYGK